MSGHTRESDQYQAELSERVNDGGGCTEMWDTLSGLRDEGNQRLRRTLLKQSAGALGVGIASLSGMVSAAEEAVEVVDVKNERGRARSSLVAQALRDQRVKQIRHEFINQGYHPRVNEAKAVTSTVEASARSTEEDVSLPDTVQVDDSWNTVVIPFEPTGDEEQVHITWTTAPNVDQQVVGQRSERIVPEDGSEPYWSVSNYILSDEGDLRVTNDTLPNFLGCDNPDKGCIALIAGAYSAEFVACATCGASAGWLIPACGYCVAAVLTAYGAHKTCDWCKD